MISYSRFLVRNILIKKGLYITVALFAILMIVITYIQADDANEINRPFISTITTFTKFFPFLLSSMFTTLITVYVFKDGEEDGSELMVVSKPITRKTILSSKFLVTLSFIIGFHLFAFIIYLIAGATDKVATIDMNVEFAGSLTVGGFMIQMIVLSIVTLLASVAGKIGTLMTGTLLAAVIPILSFVITPISGGLPVGTRFLRERMFIDANDVDNVDPTTLSAAEATSMIDYNDIYNTRANESPTKMGNEYAKYMEYSSSVWYDKFAYFDIWYQWGRFMSIFNHNYSTKTIAVQKWERANLEKNYPPHSTFKVLLKPNGQEQTSVVEKHVAIFLNQEELGIGVKGAYDSNMLDIFKNLKTDLAALHKKGYISEDIFGNGTKYPDEKAKEAADNYVNLQTTNNQPVDPKVKEELMDGYKLTDSEKYTLRILKGVVTSRSLSDKISHLNLGKNLSLLTRIKVYREMNNFLEATPFNLDDKIGIFDEDQIKTPYVFPEIIQSSDPNQSQWIFDASKPLSIYAPKPFIDTNSVIYAWTGIMAVLILSTLFVYSRRDFK